MQITNVVFPFSPQPEPFFITFAMYDAIEGKKISEDFQVDPNEPEIRSMIPEDLLNTFYNSGGGDCNDASSDINGLIEDWISKSQREVML